MPEADTWDVNFGLWPYDSVHVSVAFASVVEVFQPDNLEAEALSGQYSTMNPNCYSLIIVICDFYVLLSTYLSNYSSTQRIIN